MPEPVSRLDQQKRLFFAALLVWIIVAVGWINLLMAQLQAHTNPSYPPGVVTLPNGKTFVQDFAWQMIFFRGIRDHDLARPYTMADQENYIRQVLPTAAGGMTHAYSPVAFLLALPLIATPGQGAFLIYTILCGLGIIALFHFWLLPRASSAPQLGALSVCVFSLCLVFGILVGQSAILTTTLLGALWAVLQTRRQATWGSDLLLAILFWALCLKPSVTILPAMLLLGARAWRPLIMSALLLLATWTAVCGHYGGWLTGLRDYDHFLNHYNNAEMSPFLRRGDETATGYEITRLLFSLNRALLLGLSLGLVLLRWLNRISAPELFLGLGWVFLLFSPYLLPSEMWILCLLVVEGTFFRAQAWPTALGKLLLLAAVLDIRDGLFLPIDVNFPLKCLLAAWIMIDALRERKSHPVAAVYDRRWS
jgi:hypothetical protein